MELFNILTYPNKALREICRPVTEVEEFENDIFNGMLYMMKYFKGIGLAAPQVGFSKRLIVADTGDKIIKLANPEIIEKSGDGYMQESCLSVTGKCVNVKRSYKIVVQGLSVKSEKIEICAEGLSARVLQHEIDHLNGKLIIDYLNWWERINLH